MYAIIEDGGKQYKVEEGQSVAIEVRDVEEGAAIEFDKVLFVRDDSSSVVGQPYVDGAKVAGTVKTTAYGPKVYPMQFRRRKNSRRRIGHRQRYLEVEITSISK